MIFYLTNTGCRNSIRSPKDPLMNCKSLALVFFGGFGAIFFIVQHTANTQHTTETRSSKNLTAHQRDVQAGYVLVIQHTDCVLFHPLDIEESSVAVLVHAAQVSRVPQSRKQIRVSMGGNRSL